MRYQFTDVPWTMDGYQILAARTIDRNLPEKHVEAHALHGMVAELGEIHGIFQKRFQGHEMDDEHLKRELGDLLWFIAEFATARHWLLSDVAETNIEKLRQRYPEGFEAERSLHRRPDDD